MSSLAAVQNYFLLIGSNSYLNCKALILFFFFGGGVGVEIESRPSITDPPLCSLAQLFKHLLPSPAATECSTLAHHQSVESLLSNVKHFHPPF